MKRHRKSLILLGLLVSVLFIGFFSSVGVASSDIDYTFQNDNLFNSTGLGRQSWINNASQNFNIRQRENITGNFNATYSFTSEEDGTTSTDINYIDTDVSGGDTQAIIINSLENHDKVLQLNDSDGANRIDIFNAFSGKESGSIEFWIRSSDVTQVADYFISTGGTNTGIHFSLRNDLFRSYNGGSWDDIVGTIDNTWYHVEIDFECGAGGFEGLAPDTFFVYINGIKYGAYSFRSAIASATYSRIVSDNAATSYFIYFDAIGYSWDSYYEVGDNIFPLIEVYTEQYEVDKWEFRHNPITRFQYPDGTDDPSGWSDRGDAEPITDFVNTLNIGGVFDIVVHVDDSGGLERGFSLQDDYFEVTYNFRINQLDDDDVGANAIVLTIRDGADVISGVYIRNNDNVEIFHNGGSTVIGTVNLEANFSASFYLNFNSEVVRFVLKDWNDDSVLLDFFGGFFDTGTDTITEIEYHHIATGGDVVDSDLMSISIYDTTGSVSDDIGELRWDDVGFEYPDQLVWDFAEFNLITLESNFQNYSLFHEALGGISFKNLIYWNSENIDLANIWESYSIGGDSVQLRLWMYNNFSFDSISIDGVKLNEGLNSYPLIYDYGSVDGNKSYFYVSGDRLIYNLITDDNDLEYIQASFNINDVITENYSVSFRSDVFGASSCNFRLNYTDSTSSFIEFPTYATRTSIILPQEKELGEVIILITDNDLLNTGSTTGYIRSISFINFRDITTTIITFSLLTVLVPLMVLIIPPIAMRQKFGNSAVIPMFLLMSIVAFATGLIPIWLFFVMIISSGAFLIGKKTIGVEG